jgi:hypothetical protein
MAFRVINLLKIGVVRDALDSGLERDDFVITGHDRHSPKFETLCQMHGADRNLAARCLNVLVEDLARQPRPGHCGTSTAKLLIRADEDTEFVGHHPFPAAISQPSSDRLVLLVLAVKGSNFRGAVR